MRPASLSHRLERLSGQRTTGDLEQTVQDLAEAYGLDPAAVRAEMEHIKEQTRRFGPCTPEQAIQRCAEEFELSEAEVWQEYAQITDTIGTPR